MNNNPHHIPIYAAMAEVIVASIGVLCFPLILRAQRRQLISNQRFIAALALYGVMFSLLSVCLRSIPEPKHLYLSALLSLSGFCGLVAMLILFIADMMEKNSDPAK
jgi:small-conductance mechanosensitive channel